jgi:hypothetical protein
MVSEPRPHAVAVGGSLSGLCAGMALAFAWYDASRTELLRQTGSLQGDMVIASLANDQLPAELTGELARLARRYRPSPWDRCVAWGVTHGEVAGFPVAEYLPSRLVRDGRC